MKLIKLETNSFGGINPSSPVVIDFTQSKFISIEGDQGTGKSSLLNSLLLACGQLGAPDTKINKNFINNESDKIDINFDFVGKDKYKYSVRCTKSKFELMYEGEAVPEPLSKMKSLLGVVGVSPMEEKNKPLKEIIRWLASYSNKNPEEFDASLNKAKEGIKKSREARAAANKSYKALIETLNDEPLYKDWEGSEKKYAKAVDIQELSAKLKKAGDKSDIYLRSEEKMKRLKEDKPSIDRRVEDLKKELQAAMKLQQETDDGIVKGEKWLEENKAIKKEYDAVRKEYDNAAQQVVEFNRWQDIKKKKTEMDEYETMAQKADAKEKQLLKEVKELQAEILPDIKNVELVLEDTHENGTAKKEGLYVDGKNVAQLSESQWWSIVLLIWKKYKVKVVVIDNFQSLGSGAVQILEKLADDGAYILCAEMNRETKTLQINY